MTDEWNAFCVVPGCPLSWPMHENCARSRDKQGSKCSKKKGILTSSNKG